MVEAFKSLLSKPKVCKSSIEGHYFWSLEPLDVFSLDIRILEEEFKGAFADLG